MYKILYDKRITKEIKKIPPHTLKNILNKIEGLAENPNRRKVEKLMGVDGYRLQAGKYRILFQIDSENKTIRIFRIKHRKDVYKNL